jgi:hypothetical protein
LGAGNRRFESYYPDVEKQTKHLYLVEPKNVPQRLIDILDTRAGKVHSRDGQVVETLAEILTEYNHIIFGCCGLAHREDCPVWTPSL